MGNTHEIISNTGQIIFEVQSRSITFVKQTDQDPLKSETSGQPCMVYSDKKYSSI